MPVLNHTNFDVNAIVFSELKTTTRGSKYATVGYGDEKTQVVFQLGTFPGGTLQTQFGIGRASQDPASSLQIKLSLSADTKSFLKSLEASTLEAASHNAGTWFGRNMSTEDIAPLYKTIVKEEEQHGARVALKIFTEGEHTTKVFIVKEKNGKYTTPVAGTIEDVTERSWVIPIVKIKGGVYFLDDQCFGTSLVASELIVVQTQTSSTSPGFDFNGVEFNDEMDTEY